MDIRKDLMNAVTQLTLAIKELVENIDDKLDDDIEDTYALESGEVLECPFCGCTDCKIDAFGGNFYVTCPRCEADGPICEDVELAVRAWNHVGESRD